MKYRINGQEATKAEAHEAIRPTVPNGGVEFLENTIRNTRREKLESVTFHIGQALTLEVRF